MILRIKTICILFHAIQGILFNYVLNKTHEKILSSYVLRIFS